MDEAIAELLSLDDLKESLADRFEEELKLEVNTRTYIEEAFEEDKKLCWRKALQQRLEKVLREEKTEELKKAVRAAVAEALTKGEDQEED